MSYATEQVARAVRRESARRKRVTTNLARLGFAMDAAQMGELSSEELARNALKPLGLPIGGDPVEALDFYLAGVQRTFAADAADLPADHILTKYITGLEG